MSAWHLHHGTWWMVQYSWDGWLSFGVHLDWRRRRNSVTGQWYGPYIDMHIGCMIVSVGRQPVWSSEAGTNLGRGGRRA